MGVIFGNKQFKVMTRRTAINSIIMKVDHSTTHMLTARNRGAAEEVCGHDTFSDSITEHVARQSGGATGGKLPRVFVEPISEAL
jgi:hypothetical protein